MRFRLCYHRYPHFMTNREKWDKTLSYLQFIGFAIVIASLPLSNFFMSFGSFWIVGAWLFQIIIDLARKESLAPRFKKFTSNKNALLLTGLYALPLIGLLWTTDFKYAFWDLRMKLPILFMPFVLFSINPMTAREFRALFGIFLSSLVFALFWCLLIYWRINPKPFTDVRDISVFISHIRFSLLLVLGLCIAYHEAWNKAGGKVLCVLLTICFVYFLVVIGSITGFLVLAALIAWYFLLQVFKAKGMMRIVSLSLLLLLPSVAVFWFCKKADNYFTVQPIDWNKQDTHSARGEAYQYDRYYPMEEQGHFALIEQGHYVYSYVAPNELREAWLERTSIPVDSKDARGQTIEGTLIRYLASKDLRKDYDGVYQLTNDDLKAILNGHVDHDEVNMNALEMRLDDILFEYSSYRIDGNPSGHSVFQRFEFWKAACGIIKEHPIMGVGTGDVKEAYELQYEKMNTKLDENHRLRGHNQYLTMWVTYGIFGFLFFIVVVFYPMFNGARKDKLFMAFTIIAAMSFLTEDTLETQAGVMFFAFFYLFLLLRKKATPEQPLQAQ